MRRIVILGGGFAGLSAARRLEDDLGAHRRVEITLVTDRSHFEFTPLLARVISGGVHPASVSVPLRELLEARTRLAIDRIERIDLKTRQLVGRRQSYPYDYLILATGTSTNWNDRSRWQRHALSLQTARDATVARDAVDAALRAARRESDPDALRRLMTFVVAGAGPTGVSLISDLVDYVTTRHFPRLDPSSVGQLRFCLVEREAQILPEMQDALRAVSENHLHRVGVDLETGVAVTGRTKDVVELSSGTRIPCATFFWCGGVCPSSLAVEAGLECAEDGSALVHRTLQAVGQHGVYVAGDAASAGSFPRRAQVAASQGRLAARNVVADMSGRTRRNWDYDPGADHLTLGQNAVVDYRGIALEGRAAHAMLSMTWTAAMPSVRGKARVFKDLLASLLAPRATPATDLLLTSEPDES